MDKKQGFTLLELLVVVLIIGILATIALPQYKLAVGKTKLATIKNITKAIADAEERYFLNNAKYTNEASNLDINFTGASMSGANITWSNGNRCYIWNAGGNDGQKAVACNTKINNVFVSYYHHFTYSPRPNRRDCFAWSTDKTDTANKVCQNDTGKNSAQISCNTDSNYCYYTY